MKSVIFLLVLLAGLGLFARPAEAHMAGQPPFFKVNGVFADLYLVPGTSLTDFSLPQDMAPGTYLVGKQIDFEIDPVALGVTQEIFKTATFSWTFGDGGTGRGGKLKHTYTKQGSYILEIYVTSPELPTPQLFQSVLVNVLPRADYVLPKAHITVNGEVVKSASDAIYADLKKPVKFEGSGGETYFWDFGDATAPATTSSVEHEYPIAKYPGGLSIVSAVLRVKNSDGFLADGYAMIYDQVLNPINIEKAKAATPAAQTQTGKAGMPRLLVIGAILGVLLGIGYVIWRKNS